MTILSQMTASQQAEFFAAMNAAGIVDPVARSAAADAKANPTLTQAAVTAAGDKTARDAAADAKANPTLTSAAIVAVGGDTTARASAADAKVNPVLTAASIAPSLSSAGLPVTYATPANTLRVRAAMARSDRDINVVVIGPSTVAGQQNVSPSTQGSAGLVPQIAARLNGMGINAGAENYYGDHGSWGTAQTFDNYKAGDSRITSTGTVGLTSVQTAGGNAIQLAAAGDSITYTPLTPVRKWRVRIYNDRAGRNLTASSGTGNIPVNSANPNSIQTAIIDSGSTGLNALTLTQASSATSASIILGVDAFDDTAGRRQISVHNLGISGARSARFSDNSNTLGGQIAMTKAIAPDYMYLADFPINDWRGSISVAVYQANLQAAIDAYLPICDLCIVLPLYDGDTGGLSSTQESFVTATRQVAMANGLPILDMRSRLVSFAKAQGIGFYETNGTVHPSPFGYGFLSSVYAEDIRKLYRGGI